MGSGPSTLQNAERVIDILTGESQAGQSIFVDNYGEGEIGPLGNARLLQNAVARFREGRQYFEGGLYHLARDQFNEAVAQLMLATCPKYKEAFLHHRTPRLSIQAIVDFIDKRCDRIRLCTDAKKLASWSSIRVLEECCSEEDYRRLLDALMLILLTCFADSLKMVDCQEDARQLHCAKAKLQSALYGTEYGIKYCISCKDLCSCCMPVGEACYCGGASSGIDNTGDKEDLHKNDACGTGASVDFRANMFHADSLSSEEEAISMDNTEEEAIAALMTDFPAI
eukprot:gene4827-5294_t